MSALQCVCFCLFAGVEGPEGRRQSCDPQWALWLGRRARDERLCATGSGLLRLPDCLATPKERGLARFTKAKKLITRMQDFSYSDHVLECTSPTWKICPSWPDITWASSDFQPAPHCPSFRTAKNAQYPNYALWSGEGPRRRRLAEAMLPWRRKSFTNRLAKGDQHFCTGKIYMATEAQTSATQWRQLIILATSSLLSIFDFI